MLAWSLTVLLAACSAVAGDLLAASNLVRCVRDGTNAEDITLECLDKFVLTLSIRAGQLDDVEAVQAVFDRATREDGTVAELEDPWEITWSKSKATLVYPLTYEQTVHGRTTETILADSVPFNIDLFDKCATGDNPMCGYYYSAGGDVVPYSAGFCCACSSGQALGTDETANMRGNRCTPGDLVMTQRTAHCLNFSVHRYSAFEIHAPYHNWDIQIRIRRGRGDDASEQVLHLSPRNLTPASPDGSLLAKVIGDLASFAQPADLGAKNLFVPALPADSERVAAGVDEYLLIDKTHVAFDGRSCDKIGVSFEAFALQRNACTAKPGSCLANQLDDFREEALLLRDEGRATKHFATDLGVLHPLAYESTGESQGYQLVLDQEDLQTTLVQLTFSADDIRLVVSRSPGVIVSARVADFEALTRDGRLDVVVRNTGAVVAEYSVTVTECSTGILPVLAKVFSLAAGALHAMVFPISASYALERDNECTVSLFDSQGHLEDSRRINFTSTDLVVDYGPSEGENPRAGQAGIDVDGANGERALTCDEFCPSFIDIPCFVVKQCWSKIIYLVAIIAVIVVGVPLLIKLCGCCLRSIRSTGTRAKDDRADRRDRTVVVEREMQPIMRSRSSRDSRERWQSQSTSAPLPNADRRRKTAALRRAAVEERRVFMHPPPGRLRHVFARNPGKRFAIAGSLSLDAEDEGKVNFHVSPRIQFRTVAPGEHTGLATRQIKPPLALRTPNSQLVLPLKWATALRTIQPRPRAPCVNLPAP